MAGRCFFPKREARGRNTPPPQAPRTLPLFKEGRCGTIASFATTKHLCFTMLRLSERNANTCNCTTSESNIADRQRSAETQWRPQSRGREFFACGYLLYSLRNLPVNFSSLCQRDSCFCCFCVAWCFVRTHRCAPTFVCFFCLIVICRRGRPAIKTLPLFCNKEGVPAGGRR